MIISGGQTGVDRAAQDVAAKLGLERGGWCPRGRLAEDGAIDHSYPLRETLSERPDQRTLWNVFDSDATLIIAPDELGGGSKLTFEAAQRFGRPVLVARPEDMETAASWLDAQSGLRVLNVAGPRASEWAEGYRATERLLDTLLQPLRRRAGEAPRRALLTGGGGYLAGHLVSAAPPGWEIHLTSRRGNGGEGRSGVELSETSSVEVLFDELRPSLVIHNAYGMKEGDRDIVQATRNVASAAHRVGARLIHISSDMVLDGENGPFSESAEASPVHQYGRWKTAAERIVLESLPEAAVVRVSLLTRFSPPDPRTEWVLSGVRGEALCELFADELRTPTLVEDAARQIWEIAQLGEGAGGIWHLANPEAVSRYALGCLIAAAHGLDPQALTSSSLRSSTSPRPRDLRLLTQRADRYLPTRSRSLSELACECRVHLSSTDPRGHDG